MVLIFVGKTKILAFTCYTYVCVNIYCPFANKTNQILKAERILALMDATANLVVFTVGLPVPASKMSKKITSVHALMKCCRTQQTLPALATAQRDVGRNDSHSIASQGKQQTNSKCLFAVNHILLVVSVIGNVKSTVATDIDVPYSSRAMGLIDSLKILTILNINANGQENFRIRIVNRHLGIRIKSKPKCDRVKVRWA